MKKLLLASLFTSNAFAIDTSAVDAYYDTLGLNYFENLQMQNVYSSYDSVIDTNARVLIVDDGYQVNHEDAGHTNNNLSVSKVSYHGTLVAGIVYAKIGNINGYRGLVAPKSADFAIFGNNCNTIKFKTIQKARCRRDLLKNQIKNFDIINLSTELSEWNYNFYKIKVSNPSYSDYQKTWFPTHLKHMRLFHDLMKNNPDKLFVIAAGNENVPALYENGAIHVENYRMRDLNNVIVAGSYTGRPGSERFTHDYGMGVDFIARTGVSGPIYKSGTRNGYHTDNRYSGTSFTAPQVTGVAAMMFDVCSKMQGSTIKSTMNNAGFDTLNKTHGSKTFDYKILNAYKAVRAAINICN